MLIDVATFILVLEHANDVRKCSNRFDPNGEMVNQAVRLINPKAEHTSIIEGLSLTATVTIKGSIIEDSEIQLVQSRGRPTEIKNIKIRDETGSAQVTLWSPKNEDLEKLRVGNQVTIYNVVSRRFTGNQIFASTKNTIIEINNDDDSNVIVATLMSIETNSTEKVISVMSDGRILDFPLNLEENYNLNLENIARINGDIVITHRGDIILDIVDAAAAADTPDEDTEN